MSKTFYLVSADHSLNQTNLENAIKSSNQYLETIRDKLNTPGIVAGIHLNGTQVWAHAVGYTDIENDVITRVDSVWRLASITKSITSALVAKLVDEGLIELNKSINDYLNPRVFPQKQWKGKYVTITVGQVMSHTAGLIDFKFPEYFYTNKLHFNNVTETLAKLKDEPLLFAPGTTFSYSNYGFQIIGAIVESVLNKTFESVINKMFIEINMTSTLCERRETIIRHRARYYTKGTNSMTKIINTPLVDDLNPVEAIWSAGAVVSTVPDLLIFGSSMNKWFKGLNVSKTFNLSPRVVKQLFTPIIKIKDNIPFKFGNSVVSCNMSYAHGWFLANFNQTIPCSICKTPITEMKYHAGALSGLNTLLVIEPENNLVISVFTNYPIDDPINSLISIALNLLKNFIK